MSYSCSDFVDSIIDALGVEIPPESYDSPSEQADICLEEIARLKRIERAYQAQPRRRIEGLAALNAGVIRKTESK